MSDDESDRRCFFFFREACMEVRVSPQQDDFDAPEREEGEAQDWNEKFQVSPLTWFYYYYSLLTMLIY